MNWRGGKKEHCGYRLILKPDHPFADSQGYVREHRLVWEQAHNAMLLPWADIHHYDKNRMYNALFNLVAMMHSEHMRITNIKDMEGRACLDCGATWTYWDKVKQVFRWHYKLHGYQCTQCYRWESRREK